ncbi:MAG: cation transporter [Clostridia bacterium]|nr:cation transporter [Clostridia bacterium]
MKKTENEELAIRVSFTTMAGNFFLTLLKLFAGLFSRSSAMISDAVHSASDVLSTIIVLIGVKIANKTSDDGHQYGHERFECVAAILLSVMLAITGFLIGFSGIKTVLSGRENIAIPHSFALFVAIFSILSKEAMFHYTKNAANKINSGALMADAWHHRSDALSSIGSFIGILGAKMGFPFLDPLASVVICLFIIKVAVEIFIDAVEKMTDRSADSETILKIRELVQSEDGVIAIDDLKTRKFGDKIYIDLEISADGNMSLTAAHDIAERVHDDIEASLPNVKHCMVHINPHLQTEN